MSPNKVHSDPSNSLGCPLAAATAIRGGLKFPHAERFVPLPEIIALQSTVKRDNVLNKGRQAGAGQSSAWLYEFQSPNHLNPHTEPDQHHLCSGQGLACQDRPFTPCLGFYHELHFGLAHFSFVPGTELDSYM